eukprot:GFKZ01001000.1.p1 GENE.GFKZ01001000.1~~GFKZ01001000.1.p1  ORF type:complete len:161 (+),score=0.58 GFKZ01001000.1:107-589(+)
MVPHREYTLVFLLAILLASPSTVAQRNCRCPPESDNFTRQYYKAHIVVRAYVLSQFSSCHLCPRPADRRNAVRVYALYTFRKYRGPHPGSVFYAQSFENTRYCGVRLRTGESYMLNLANPRDTSAASHWTQGWYVLEACQSHYNWAALNRRQQAFLNSRL